MFQYHRNRAMKETRSSSDSESDGPPSKPPDLCKDFKSFVDKKSAEKALKKLLGYPGSGHGLSQMDRKLIEGILGPNRKEKRLGQNFLKQD